MADIHLTQSEAEALIAMEKHRLDDERHSYPTSGSLIVPLQSPDKRKRPVSDKPCYPDRVWEALVGGGLSIVTGLASGSNSSNLEFGQVGNFSRVSLSHA